MRWLTKAGVYSLSSLVCCLNVSLIELKLAITKIVRNQESIISAEIRSLAVIVVGAISPNPAVEKVAILKYKNVIM